MMHIRSGRALIHLTMATEPSRVDTEHLVQLFDSDESLADAVGAFLHEGFVRGETLLAVMDEQRWYAVAMRLSSWGVPVDQVMRSGQLTVRAAAETLKTFMRLGRADRDLFEDSVGALIRDLSGRGAPLRIYGEMVNLLAAAGEYRAAHELEELWNNLGRRSVYRLFCGYAAAHFGDPRTLGALRRICASHSQVLSSPQDVLGSFLLNAYVGN
jgi:MEDS: MEthanogen/methylotroph, DcmR Sensory domain